MSRNLGWTDEIIAEVTKYPHSIITMLTDFGLSDGFVGVMKGVIVQTAPRSRVIDITHDLPPFSIESAAFLLHWAFGYFQVGTVHLCVVDPGVGSGRRVLLVRKAGHFFVAPDNGVLTHILTMEGDADIIHVTNQRYFMDKISHTFHGRDIFAPVAAHLANGVDFFEFGELISDPKVLPILPLQLSEQSIECCIEYIDRFGNVVTNLSQQVFESWLNDHSINPEHVIIQCGECEIKGVTCAYGFKKTGELLAVLDGYDRLEIAENCGNAAQRLGVAIGDLIKVCNQKV